MPAVKETEVFKGTAARVFVNDVPPIGNLLYSYIWQLSAMRLASTWTSGPSSPLLKRRAEASTAIVVDHSFLTVLLLHELTVVADLRMAHAQRLLRWCSCSVKPVWPKLLVGDTQDVKALSCHVGRWLPALMF